MLKKWNVKDVIRQQKMLQTLIDKETDLTRKDYLTYVLEDTNSFIRQMTEDMPEYRSLRVNKLYNTFFDTISHQRYYSIVSDFLFSLDDKAEEIQVADDLVDKRLKPKNNYKNLGSIKATPEEVFAHTAEFYKAIDPEIRDWFLEVEKNSLLAVSKRSNSILENDCNGITYFIDGVKANLIIVRRNETEKMYGTMVHEYGHAVKNIVDPTAVNYEGYDLFDEIPSIFMELLAYEENMPGYSKEMMDYLKYRAFGIYFNFAYQLDNHAYIAYQYERANYETTSTFYRRLKSEEDIDIEDYRKSLDRTIFDDGAYVLSYITALELLHIYREDKREALKLFKKILMASPCVQRLGVIQSIVPLNNYAREECEKVISDVTLSLKR